LDEVAARIRGFRAWRLRKVLDKKSDAAKLAGAGSFFPKSVKSGACKEVIEKGTDVNYSTFPFWKCCPRMGGGSSHFLLWCYENPRPESECRECTAWQVYDERTTGCTGDARSTGRNISGERERRIPKAGFLERGDWRRPGDGASGDAAIQRPRRDDVCRVFAARAREMVPWRTNDLEVPANAEIVLEGTSFE